MDVKMDEGRKMHFKYYVYPILSDLLMAKVWNVIKFFDAVISCAKRRMYDVYDV